MGKQQWRDEFIGAMARAGVRVDVARAWLRRAATAQRLAEASCNGDYPADNGERKVKPCPSCEVGWSPGSFRGGVCPECSHERLMTRKLAAELPGWTAQFHGDPRGCVVVLGTPEGREIGVPS